jgi:hypothetical protein
MKAVLIAHNMAIDGEVTDMLESLDIPSFTKFTDMLGKGRLSEPHLNTEVWPGINYGTFVVIEDAKAAGIMDAVRQMRQTLGSEGVKAFMWTIDEVT